MTGEKLRAIGLMLLASLLVSACTREPPVERSAARPAVKANDAREGTVTVSADGNGDLHLNWRPPLTALSRGQLAQARRDASQALERGRLYQGPQDAIPLYLSVLRVDAQDSRARRGLQRSIEALLNQGRKALADADEDAGELQQAATIAAVLRTVAPDSKSAEAYLADVDSAEQLWRLNTNGERQLREGQLGEAGAGALDSFREALSLQPGQARARQGLAATESALIRRAEDAAAQSDFATAERWLGAAAGVREDAPTIADARQRIQRIRAAQIAALRDSGIKDLRTPLGLKPAREKLAEVLRIAAPGDSVAADFRRRIDLATYYGLFRPGQGFTDGMNSGGRGPQMAVVPHGGFRMGAGEQELGAADAEKPAHYVRFDRGFAVSRHPITVGEFRRFVQATHYRPRATRRGHSIVYDERSGNFVRRSGVDWQSDYAGATAADDLPVVHISVRDAEAYADWLAEQTGRGYRLLSEAEFEYIVRAGRSGRYPWGNGQPPAGSGNLTGGNDVSPSGRHWNNAFVGYGDGHWGPAPVASYPANPWGLGDAGSNISEWVADCWHASYRRAPADGVPWFNPGCRSRVIRGGSWASSPQQSRAAWRSSSDSDMTNARVGFRVARGI